MWRGLGGEPRCGFADQGDHIGNALGAVGAQLTAEIKRGERRFDVGLANVGGVFALDGFQDERDDAFGDPGIAIGKESQLAIALRGVNPDAGGAAPNECRIGFQRVGHFWQSLTQIDQQAVSIIGVEKIIVIIHIG
jgi:hypothetical protein